MFPLATAIELDSMLQLTYPPQPAASKRRVSKEQLSDIAELFAYYDTDGDGSITLDDLRRASARSDLISEADLIAMIRSMDTDGDDVVSFDDFVMNMVADLQQQHQAMQSQQSESAGSPRGKLMSRRGSTSSSNYGLAPSSSSATYSASPRS